jgi:hypothetical protein
MRSTASALLALLSSRMFVILEEDGVKALRQ